MIEMITLNGITYQVQQAGSGTPLLMLHGFTGTSSTWNSIQHTLQSNFHLIAPDLIGHGQTGTPDDPERYAMQHAAADLVALLDHLNIDTCHLLGYSMGGRLALYTAVHYRDRIRTLTLESSSPGLRTEAERNERRERDNTLADRIERDDIAAFVDFWQSLSLWASQADTLDAQAQADLRTERLSQHPKGLANSLLGMGTGVQPSLWDHLPDLDLPVQLIVGEHDAKFIGINQTIQTALFDAQLTVIPNAGHTAHLENPQAFAQTVLTFLNQHG